MEVRPALSLPFSKYFAFRVKPYTKGTQNTSILTWRDDMDDSGLDDERDDDVERVDCIGRVSRIMLCTLHLNAAAHLRRGSGRRRRERARVLLVLLLDVLEVGLRVLSHGSSGSKG
jgi:hypothetical protein